MKNLDRYFLSFLTIIAFSSLLFGFNPKQVNASEQCDVQDLTSGVGNAPLSRNSFTPRISADGKRISFESHRDFLGTNTDLNREIYYYDSTIDNFIQVTNTTGATNRFADISGNGNRIIFKSPLDLTGDNADLNQEHFLFDIPTSMLTQVTNTTGGGSSSREFPLSNLDGTIFAFVSSHGFVGPNPGSNSEIFLYDLPTDTFTQVSNTLGKFNFEPALSADGTRVVFISNEDFTGGNSDNNAEIFLYDTTISMFTQITDTTGGSVNTNGFPDISADGTKIVFQSNNDHSGNNGDLSFEIFLFDTTTSTFTQITNTTDGSTFNPSTNSDGTRIVFESNRDITGDNADLNSEIFLYDVTTDMFTQISDSTGSGGFMADINADGTKITFELGGTRQIYLAECGIADSDGDGVDDNSDQCDESNTDLTIRIDGCDSGISNFIDADGCSISDLITEIANDSSNHGNFVSVVSHLLNDLKKAGLISGSDKGAIQSCASEADIP